MRRIHRLCDATRQGHFPHSLDGIYENQHVQQVLQFNHLYQFLTIASQSSMLTDRSQQQTPPATPKAKLANIDPQSPSKASLPLLKENVFEDVYMNTAKGFSGLPDVRMATARGGFTLKNDVHMETYRGGPTLKQGGLQLWERELIDAPEVKRKATVAQLCKTAFDIMQRCRSLIGLILHSTDFLDYYFQALGYLAARKERRARFDTDTRSRNVLPASSEYLKEFKSYCGRERVILRRRRTKLKVDQFHIIAQVGQGGYGEVFLARKQVRICIQVKYYMRLSV